MKAKGLLIIFIILVSLLPAYAASKALERMLRPRESAGRLLLFLLLALALVFVYTILLGLVIRWIFPGA